MKETPLTKLHEEIAACPIGGLCRHLNHFRVNGVCPARECSPKCKSDTTSYTLEHHSSRIECRNFRCGNGATLCGFFCRYCLSRSHHACLLRSRVHVRHRLLRRSPLNPQNALILRPYLRKLSSRIRSRSSPGNRAVRTIPSSPARSRLSKALRLRIKVRIRIRLRNQRDSSPNESSA